MKRIITIFLVLISFASCEDVIEVDTPSESPRLVVDGIIRIDTSEAFTTARIKISTSSSFFDPNTPVSADLVRIQNVLYEPEIAGEGNFINLAEVEPGIYEGGKSTRFFTEGRLDLYVNYNDERFYAGTSFVPSVPIDSLRQGTETLFSEDETEIIVSYTDLGNRNDFYVFDFGFNEFLVTEDEFYQGQTFEFSYFYEDGLEAGTKLNISLLGADEGFFNYMNQVIVQSGGDQGPFQTPAATVRGNVFNVTGLDNIEVFDNVERSNNFALGYFAVVQEYQSNITIE
ncbi:DUF4249 family protein [Maribacter cobaltidurans]|uniref:Uncharacterized protein n=1 Tax=Maribacter cobaltidurans TaxID=1178778 RepID=A0A223V9X4_9FLAO|nr:DUF4249 family protein [Maribacter cobaltidurans]ASV31940.1 hypothetical protein CJ263_17920 [Maribacter cobaltidurans]GGD85890.1 hypothetical protein GCM10011412_24600 [Maribacter cobaltidurans]